MQVDLFEVLRNSVSHLLEMLFFFCSLIFSSTSVECTAKFSQKRLPISSEKLTSSVP